MKKKITSQFKSKPTYDLYNKLWYTLDTYLMIRIDSYIFFEYNEWNIKELSINNLNILKCIYEYDYKVFKTFLFLYWNLEHYLESTDYVKYALKTNTENLDFINIMLNTKFRSNLVFVSKIKNLIESLNQSNE